VEQDKVECHKVSEDSKRVILFGNIYNKYVFPSRSLGTSDHLDKIKKGKKMTVIRLTRMGRNKKPFYRIVVTDSRKRRDSGWIESIGYYNPVSEPKQLKFDQERLDYWLSVGAKASERVQKLTGLKK
jgi:small subunit ribosomal protein S16